MDLKNRILKNTEIQLRRKGFLFGFNVGGGGGFILNNPSATEVKMLTQKDIINI